MGDGVTDNFFQSVEGAYSLRGLNLVNFTLLPFCRLSSYLAISKGYNEKRL